MNLLGRLICLAGVALLVVGCPSPSGPAGNVRLKVTVAFDTTAEEEDLWNKGTISAEGEFPAAKLDTMDIGAEYAWDLLGPTPWTATTSQQVGDFIGDCNGDVCDPCTGDFSGTWQISAVQLDMQERGGGRYVFELWLGSDRPPHTGGCDAMINSPVYWGSRMTVTLVGMNTATPTGTATVPGSPDEAITVEVSK